MVFNPADPYSFIEPLKTLSNIGLPFTGLKLSPDSPVSVAYSTTLIYVSFLLNGILISYYLSGVPSGSEENLQILFRRSTIRTDTGEFERILGNGHGHELYLPRLSIVTIPVRYWSEHVLLFVSVKR